MDCKLKTTEDVQPFISDYNWLVVELDKSIETVIEKIQKKKLWNNQSVSSTTTNNNSNNGKHYRSSNNGY